MTDQPQTPPIIPPKKSIWTRWWMIVLYVFVGLIILVALLPTDEESGDEIAAPSTTVAGPITTTTSVPATTPTTLPEGFEPFTVEGSGDDFFEFSTPDDLPAVLEISHNGSANFSVTSYTAGDDYIDLLVNEIGSYEGNRPVNFLIGEEVGFLEIAADGSWEISVVHLFDREVVSAEANGLGDDVVIMNIGSSTVSLSHGGDANFAVWAWTEDDRDLLVNEIGPYEGTVRSPTGLVVFDVSANGPWAILDK